MMYANSINQFIGVTYKKLLGRQCRHHNGYFETLAAAKEACTRSGTRPIIGCFAVASIRDFGCDAGSYQLCFTTELINQSNACVYEKIG